MSVYARFKRDPEGLRRLVELLEATAPTRRQKMIDVGMVEDAPYTLKALEYVMVFDDIVQLPEMELAEVCAKVPPRMLGFALNGQSDPVKERFLRCCKPIVATEVRDLFEAKLGSREVGGAQVKVIESARELERKGLVRTKRIPLG